MGKASVEPESMKEQVLKQMALFAGLPSSEIKHLAGALREREFPAGAIFIQEGDTADFFFIVIQGEVEIIKALGTPNERVLSVGQPGSFLGEMGLINPGSRRTASARTRTPARLLLMTRADFDALLHRQPVLAYEMVRVLSGRLDQAQNRTILDLEEKNLQLTQAYDRLKAAQQQLIEKEKMERELDVARGIQQSMVPRMRPHLASFDFGARMMPARAVGGDFFDFIPLNENALGIVIGDVSDKGVPAALFMALTSNLVRAEARRSSSPSDVLRHVNRQLMEINDAGMFVTLFYGVLDSATRQLHYARAGHELPIIYDAHGDLIVLPQAPGLPLGAADEILLDEQTMVLPSGSTVLLYTDGVIDALDAEGNQFGLERLRQTLLQLRNSPAQALCDTLLQMTENHRAEIPQYDDITLVVIRVN
jgi:serine phosphatase RsbU (regulator of sigma subunit)